MNIVKNAVSALIRYKLFTALNVLGLTITITMVYILMIPVYNALTYNKGITDNDRLYVVTHNFIPGQERCEFFPPGLVKLITENNPYIEDYAHAKNKEYNFEDGELTVLLQLSRKNIGMFGFEIADGEWDNIFKYDGYAVSESYAQKNCINIGDSVYFNKENNIGNIVHAIFKDPQRNSYLGNVNIIGNDNKKNLNDENEWGIMSTPFIVKLHSSDMEKEFLDCFVQNLEKQNVKTPFITEKLSPENVYEYIHMTPIGQIYFETSHFEDGQSVFERGRLDVTLLLLTISIMLFAIAFINYFNLFTAIIPWRIHSINTQKIMGAYTAELRCELLTECLLIITASLILSYPIIKYLNETDFFHLWGGIELLPADNMSVALMIASISIAASLLMALYPTWYITSFSPSFVIKGRFGASASGKKLRYTLICAQFVISFFFITSCFIVYQQFAIRSNSDWGISFDNISQYPLRHNINYNISSQILPVLHDKFLNCNDVEEVSFMHKSFTSYNGLDKESLFNSPDPEKRKLKYRFVGVYHNFIDFMGIDIIDGRAFNTGDKEKGSVAIINETMHKKLGIEIGETLRIHQYYWSKNDTIDERAVVVGICRDFYHNDLHSAIEPLALIHSPSIPLVHALIKTEKECDLTALNKHITGEFRAIEPGASPSVNIFSLKETILENWLSAEQETLDILLPLSGIAVTVSLLGVFGLVAFETRQRYKEIAIRRVNGALVKDILMLFNKRFIYILIGCFTFTVPLLIYASEQWQQNFSNKAALQVWPFAVSFAFVSLLTIAIITISAWKVVNRNPIEVIKTD